MMKVTKRSLFVFKDALQFTIKGCFKIKVSIRPISQRFHVVLTK